MTLALRPWALVSTYRSTGLPSAVLPNSLFTTLPFIGDPPLACGSVSAADADRTARPPIRPSTRLLRYMNTLLDESVVRARQSTGDYMANRRQLPGGRWQIDREARSPGWVCKKTKSQRFFA